MRIAPAWLTCLTITMSGCLVGPTVVVDDEGEASEEAGAGEEEGAPEQGGSGEEQEGPNEDEDDQDGGGGFVPQDEGPLPDFDYCDPLNPVCDEGEKCNIFRYDSEFMAACVPIAAETVGRGESCTLVEDVEPGVDTCESGTVCWDVMDGRGTCLSFCDINDDDAHEGCGEDFICNWGKSFPGDAGLCTPTCGPLDEASCPATCGCFWEGSAFLCLPLGSNLQPGEVCGFTNDCAMGSFCAYAEVTPDCEGSSCCAAFCDLSNPQCDDEQTACLPFFEEGQAPSEYAELGICILPDSY